MNMCGRYEHKESDWMKKDWMAMARCKRGGWGRGMGKGSGHVGLNSHLDHLEDLLG